MHFSNFSYKFNKKFECLTKYFKLIRIKKEEKYFCPLYE